MRLTRLCFAIFLACAVFPLPNLVAQTPAPIGPTDAIGFDYSDANMTNFAVLGFEAQYDGGPWASLGIPASVVLPDTPAGSKTYKAISPFASGTHSVQFRSCNAAGCGSASVPFAFAHVNSPTVAPGNVRKVPR